MSWVMDAGMAENRESRRSILLIFFNIRGLVRQDRIVHRDVLQYSGEDRPLGRLEVTSRILHYLSRFSTHRCSRQRPQWSSWYAAQDATLGSKPTYHVRKDGASQFPPPPCPHVRTLVVGHGAATPNLRASRRSAWVVSAVSASAIPARRPTLCVLIGA